MDVQEEEEKKEEKKDQSRPNKLLSLLIPTIFGAKWTRDSDFFKRKIRLNIETTENNAMEQRN